MAMMLQATTLGKHVFDISGREIDIGWLGLAEFAPIALLVFVSGVIADRFDRRKVAAFALGGEFLCSVSLGLYSLTDPTRVWPFFVLAACIGTARAFLSPSTRALFPAVAPEGGLPPVIALSSGVWNAAMIAGPATSGLLYTVHPSAAYFTTSVFTLAGIVMILRVRLARPPVARRPDERTTLRSTVEGLRFIRRTPVLYGAIALDLYAVLLGGAVALLPAIAEKRLGVGDVAYGWLRSSVGIGATLTALLLAVRPIHRRVGRRLLIAVGVFGLGTVVLGLTTSYWVAFAAIAVLSGADMVSVYVRGSLVPLITPDAKRGRVLAVENVFIGATNELGAFKSGVASQALGLPLAVAGGGVATIVVVGVWWFRYPELRDIDRFADVETRARDGD